MTEPKSRPKTSPQAFAYVLMSGDNPTAVSTNLQAAQDDALTRQTQWAGASEWDYRWDEYIPGEVWRLMQRRKGVEGKGRRFSWTQRAVHRTETVGGSA